jgi:hypothetical protein
LVIAAPGLCSPSRNVVSKIIICSMNIPNLIAGFYPLVL